MPAQVKKPKQKASVEGAMEKVARKIIGMIRNETFYSIERLNSAIRKALVDARTVLGIENASHPIGEWHAFNLYSIALKTLCFLLSTADNLAYPDAQLLPFYRVGGTSRLSVSLPRPRLRAEDNN